MTPRRKKAPRMRGGGIGSCGHGARKKHRGKGSKGGKGMAGTGKRAGHKKIGILKNYKNYLGKKGLVSRKKVKIINLDKIEKNLENFLKKGIAKKTAGGIEVNLKDYKILSSGEIKNKYIIKAKSASANAIKKITKAGGKVESPSPEKGEKKSKQKEKQK